MNTMSTMRTMCTASPAAPPSAERGFALIAALFLVVIVAIIGAGMMVANRAQQLGAAQEVLGAQVYQAARAGLQYGINQVLVPGTPSCPASFGFTPPQWDGRFRIIVTCAATARAGGGNTYTEYRISAVACSAASDCSTTVTEQLAERKLAASVWAVSTGTKGRVFVREDF